MTGLSEAAVAVPVGDANAEDHRMLIGGEWVPSQSGKTFENFNPTTRSAFCQIPDGTVADLDAAVEAAAQAQPTWAALPAAARAEVLYKAVDVFNARQNEFLDALITETGSTFGKAMFEISLVPAALREAAGLVNRELGEIMPSNVPGKVNMTVRQPAGVVGVISPWNFPLYLSLRGFIYALALGNTAVIKPSEDAPLTGGIMIAQFLEEAGLPKGVVNVVTCSRGSVAEVGRRMIEHPKVDRISFTGSTAVGKQIANQCSANLKRVILEMGGKNPLIVLKDADVDHAVDIAFFGAFLHQGQICMSTDKLIVAKELAAEFTEKLVAKVKQFQPMSPSEQMSVIGPIINDRQLDKINSIVQDAVANGATIECGGQKQGPFFQPTVISGGPRDMRAYREEIFGPVALVIPADNEDEAIAIANDTEYGLSAGLVTADTLRAQTLVRRIKAGMVHINDSTVHDEPHCPFGGMKSSGWFGKWGGKGAIEAFTDQQWVTLQSEARQFPF